MSNSAQRLDKFHLKGNASFTIREGWLTKGLRNVENDPEVFLRDNATEILGIGSVMVKSLRFWMQATGLTVEPRVGRRVQSLTAFGKLIMENDPYLEELFSLYAIHSHLVTNRSMTTVWHLLFNYFDASRFSRETLENSLLSTFREMVTDDFSLSSFRDDCTLALKTYVADKSKQLSPEDNMQCPLTALDFFSKTTKDAYERTIPSTAKLHSYVVLYVMLNAMESRSSISLDKLLNEPNQVGKVLHLNAYRINAYLDELQASGLLTVQRTAGLNMIYPTEGITALEIAQRYYRR
ncbi:MAG: DUF4007 family protein [Acinetobacter sp.]